MRHLWLVLGFLSLGLGAAGAVLPLLPTTPFILLAAFCFGKSSPRFHAWLIGHRLFGPMIADWRERRAIRPRAKATAIGVMAATLAGSAIYGVNPTVLAIQAAALACSATYILTRNSS